MGFSRRRLAFTALLLLCLSYEGFSQHDTTVDICVYGGTSAGVIAGYSAKRLGHSAVLIEPGGQVGGMTTGGLGETDIGNKDAISGLARDFYRRLGAYYGRAESWIFEPHVAAAVFDDYIRAVKLPVWLHYGLNRVEKKGAAITAIILERTDFATQAGLAQYTSRAESDSLFRVMPLFSTYKDNYFSGGTALDARPSKYNSDVKYQVSIRDILWRDITPAHLIPFITYSQRSFWNILLPSSPFGDNNYNPSVGVAKRLLAHDRLLGVATVVVEHESNGRDSIYSRAWNRVSFAFQGPISSRATLRVKAWIPFLYTDGNPDILQYYGYGEVAVNYVLLPQQLLIDVTVRKGDRWDWRGYAQTQLEYSPWKKFNGYILLQWFQGYGEDLLNYNVKVSMLRIGLLLKSDHLTFP